MNRPIPLVALTLILIGTAARLPAPIVEESPNPAAKTKRAEGKSSSDFTASSNQSAFGPFVGIWKGNVTSTTKSDTAALNRSSTKSGILEVLKDGDVQWGKLANGQYQYHAKASLSSDKHELLWSYQNFDEHANQRWTFSLRLADPKTANYQANGSVTSPFANGTTTASGTLTKR